jgi:hypothetical protein
MIKFINEQCIAGETYVRFPVLEFSGEIDADRLRIAYKGKIVKGYTIMPESQARDPGKYRVCFDDEDGGSGYVEELVFPSFLFADDDPPVILPVFEPRDDMTEVWFRKSDLHNLELLAEYTPNEAQVINVDVKPEPILKSKMSREDVVRSIRDSVLCIHQIVMDLSEEKALDAAVSFLKKNPCEFIPVERLSKDTFPNVSSPHKSFKTNLVNIALLEAGYHEKMSYSEIVKLFK